MADPRTFSFTSRSAAATGMTNELSPLTLGTISDSLSDLNANDVDLLSTRSTRSTEVGDISEVSRTSSGSVSTDISSMTASPPPTLSRDTSFTALGLLPPPVQRPATLQSSGSLACHYTMVEAMIPAENRLRQEFTLKASLKRETFHVVHKVVVNDPDELREYYLKENSADSHLSELEAASADFFRLHAPHHVPASTYAVYEYKQGQIHYCGVVSEEIPDFKPVAKYPLREEDLAPDRLAEPALIEVLEDFDEKLYLIDDEIARLIRRQKKLTEQQHSLEAELQQRPASRLQGAMVRYEVVIATLQEIDDQQHELRKQRRQSFSNLFKEHTVTYVEFDSYRKTKGNTIGNLLRYAFHDEDGHSYNNDNNGRLIDFDMALLPISYEVKDSSVVNWAIRYPKSFDVTHYDIVHFPNLRDAKFFFWPTNPPPIIPESAIPMLQSMTSISKNTYSTDTMAVYKKMQTKHVSVYHKFAMLLRLIVTNADLYRAIAALHVRPESRFPDDSRYANQFLLDGITQFMAKRIQNFKDKLLSLPEFAEFIKHYGKALFARIIKEHAARNAIFQTKVIALQVEVDELTLQKESLSNTNQHLQQQIDAALAESSPLPFHLEVVDDYSLTLDATKERELRQLQQQQSDEQRLQIQVHAENAKNVKRIDADILRKTSIIKQYKALMVDTAYLEATCRAISARLQNEVLPAQQDNRQRATSATQHSPRLPITMPPVSVGKIAVVPTSLFGLSAIPFFRTAQRSQSSRPVAVHDYGMVRDKVIEKMQLYCKGGQSRNHHATAVALEEYCKKLRPAPTDTQANSACVQDIKQYLQRIHDDVVKKESQEWRLMNGSFITLIKELLQDTNLWGLCTPALSALTFSQ